MRWVVPERLPEPTSPSLSPRAVIDSALHALADNDHPDDNSGLATLHALCAPGAMIGGTPMESDAADFIENLDDEAREVLTEHAAATPQGLDESPSDALVTYALNDERTCTVVKFHLRRESPDRPFLIHSIDLRNTS